ncbi:MAG: hypothetical protein HOD92_13460 [Deltaproteobacteria bacterium]|nr:hypothetical protein [Deltaproteobacteria bacterium]
MKHSTIQNMIIISALFVLLFSNSTSAQEIKKSPHDQRQYRSLTLKNGLEVLLISDPKSELAAASLSIRAGLFNDPPNREGLAHFLEHMLFLGNEKYPIPGDFEKFLSSHGGYSNANTNNEETNFFFTVQDDYFKKALDRFAHFFISPGFYPDFVDREINAVHSEYQKSLKNDGNRIYQVFKETANPKHPITKFGMGNRTTLQDSDGKSEQLYQDLLRFYQTHYSANMMKLVLLGIEPLDQLEQYLAKYFSKIVNKQLKTEKITEPLINAKLPRLISVKPIKQVRRLKVMFKIPSQTPHLKYKPRQVISSLIGDEGPGSLLSYLKSQGWVTGLTSGTGMKTHDHALYEIGIGLTKNGVNHVNDIMESMFSYINLIQADQNRQRYYREMAKLAAVEFQFQEKTEPIWYVKKLASNLQLVDVEDVLTLPWAYEKYRLDLENNILQYLKPEFMQLVLIAETVKTNLKEKWYQTEYAINKIDDKVIYRWNHPKQITQLKLPPTNPFIPDKIVLKDEPLGDETPILLKQTPKVKIWYKHDNTFNIPKGNLRISITTSKAYTTVKNAIKTKLFTRLLQENLNEYAYPAASAGLRYSLFGTTTGLILNISGYAENMGLLLSKVLDGFNHFNFEPSKFEIIKEQMLNQRLNQKRAQAYRRTMYENLYLLSKSFWHFDEYISELPNITAEAVKSFVPELMKNFNIEILAHGNFSISEIRNMGKIIEKGLNIEGAEVNQDLQENTMQLKPGQKLVYGFEASDINSALQCYYQADKQNEKQTVALEVIGKILEKPFYHQLRTIDQLGYLVSLSPYPLNRVDGFIFLIQSGEKDPVFLQKRVDRFLAENTQLINQISQSDLDQIIKTLIENKLEPPKNLNEETKKYWHIITSREYDFSIHLKEVAVLKTLKREDIVQVFNRFFLNPKKAKRISIQAWGKNHQSNIQKENWISNITKFRESMDYYPNPAGEITSQLLQK